MTLATECHLPREGSVRVEHGSGTDALLSAQVTIGHSIKMGADPRRCRVLVHGEHSPEVTQMLLEIVVAELRASGHRC